MDNLPTLSSTVTSYHNQTVTIATMSSFGAFTKPCTAKCLLFIGGCSQARFFSAGAQNCKTMTNPCLQPDLPAQTGLTRATSISFHLISLCHYLEEKNSRNSPKHALPALAKVRNVSHGVLNHNDQKERGIYSKSTALGTFKLKC